MDATYKDLSSYLPITQKQKDQYSSQFLKFIHLDYIICIKDNQERLIAFAISMPSYSKGLKKAKGKLFPFGFLYLLNAHYRNDTIAFYLIGVVPELQNKGVTAIIFEEFIKALQKKNIKYLETNPELEEIKAYKGCGKIIILSSIKLDAPSVNTFLNRGIWHYRSTSLNRMESFVFF